MSLRDHLQAIYDEHGCLTADLVVETARPEDHPLHGLVFDRPSEEAAEAWYRDRAHRLIQRVKITYRKSEESEPQRIRAFHAMRSPTGYTYEPAEKVAEDPLMRQVLIREMERDWRAFKARYEHFEEFSELLEGEVEALKAAA